MYHFETFSEKEIKARNRSRPIIHGAEPNIANYSNPHLIILLINAGADIKAMDKNGIGAMYKAVRRNRTEVVKALLKIHKVPDVNAIVDGATLLYFSIDQSLPKITRLLLSMGANINTVDGAGNSLLQNAISSDRTSSAKILIDHGIDIEWKNNSGYTALDMALLSGRIVVTDMLLRAGAKTHIRKDETLLHSAVRYSEYDIIEEVIDVCECIDAQDESGNTALHIAVLAKRSDAVEKLLQRGIDVSIKNSRGQTARDLAYNNGSNDIVTAIEESMSSGRKEKESESE